MSGQQRLVLWQTLIITFAVAAAILGITAGCYFTGHRTAALRSQCIDAGGTWMAGDCVMVRSGS